MLSETRQCCRFSDVSGVELLMNNHQSLRAEIDARAENFSICVNLGKDLLHRRHPRSDEVSKPQCIFSINHKLCIMLSVVTMVRDQPNSRFHSHNIS